ncbi:FAD/NAD(P)-binding protein [Rhizobium etli]|nr:FAD/NAD(P)-binding protein [Rhizobium etli]
MRDDPSMAHHARPRSCENEGCMSVQDPAGAGGITIVIIGGGFTGAAVAAHLLADGKLAAGVKVVVVEPREDLGRGLAYNTNDPAHRINVPAGKMTLFPERPDDFLNYLAGCSTEVADERLIGRDGLPYPRRSVFGDCVAARLRPLIAEGRIEHWRATIRTVRRDDQAYRLQAIDGSELRADFLVLAVSHPPPALPRVLAPLRGNAKLVTDVTVAGALAAIAAYDRVLIIGNGLTAADVVASLKRRRHHGHIISISRRGLRSRGHGPAGQEALGDFVTEPAMTASRLLRCVRAAVREAEAKGLTWHCVLDAVRLQGQAVWAALPMVERRRIARHVRPFWDVHRFRIAPQVEDVINDALTSRKLEILAASVAAVERTGSAFKVSLPQRHKPDRREITVDAIVVTTGPGHGGILESQNFLRDLTVAGLLQPCPTGLGIACNGDAHPISQGGEAVSDVLIAGPLARGTFGELMGLP